MKNSSNFSVLEVLVLQKLRNAGGKRKLEVLARECTKEEATIASIVEGLAEKGAVKIAKRRLTIVSLTDEGLKYAKEGLPERKILRKIVAMGGKVPLKRLTASIKMNKQMKAALGWAKKKGWIEIERDGEEQLVHALSESPPEGYDEKILKELSQSSGRISIINRVDSELQRTLQKLKARKLVKVEEKTEITIFLTKEGEEMLKQASESQVIKALTREHIVEGTWRKGYFKQYDVTAKPPEFYPGKLHVLNEITDRARQTLLFMGFEECTGSIVELEFWSFDMLFYAQEHPSRSLSEVYWIKTPNEGEVVHKELINRVKATHENGWITGSKGWGSKWSIQRSKKLILNIEPMSPLIRYLTTHKRPPIRAFCILRTFRREISDVETPVEDMQLGGVYSDEDANISKLLGILKKILIELGIDKMKIRPAYLPYAEPSIEIRIKHAGGSWLTCAKGGLIRPEIRRILELEKPAIIWSVNLSNVALTCLKLCSYGELYSKDLNILRKQAEWLS